MEKVLRTRLATVAIVALVFLAGIAVGAALYPVVGPERASGAVGTPPAGRGERQGGPRGRMRVIDQVELTSEQKAEVDSIVAYHRGKVAELWREMRPRLEAATESTRADIRRILTPEQQARYRSLLADYERKWGERSRSREHRER